MLEAGSTVSEATVVLVAATLAGMAQDDWHILSILLGGGLLALAMIILHADELRQEGVERQEAALDPRASATHVRVFAPPPRESATSHQGRAGERCGRICTRRSRKKSDCVSEKHM